MKKIYIAGPDIFRQDVKSWAEDIRELVASFGFKALLPTDNEETTAEKIYGANCNLIRQCDIVLANVNEFRGIEPDSGTCFEIGFAAALGRRILMYTHDVRSLKDRVSVSTYIHWCDEQLDNEGYKIEDFDLPLNLMLACSGYVVHGGIHTALTYLKDHCDF